MSSIQQQLFEHKLAAKHSLSVEEQKKLEKVTTM